MALENIEKLPVKAQKALLPYLEKAPDKHYYRQSA